VFNHNHSQTKPPKQAKTVQNSVDLNKNKEIVSLVQETQKQFDHMAKDTKFRHNARLNYDSGTSNRQSR